MNTRFHYPLHILNLLVLAIISFQLSLSSSYTFPWRPGLGRRRSFRSQTAWRLRGDEISHPPAPPSPSKFRRLPHLCQRYLTSLEIKIVFTEIKVVFYYDTTTADLMGGRCWLLIIIEKFKDFQLVCVNHRKKFMRK